MPVRATQPGGDQPATQNDFDTGSHPFQKTDHGKAAEGLTQIIQRKSNHRRLFTFQMSQETLAEISIEGIVCRRFRRSDQINAADRRKVRVLIITKAEADGRN